MRSSPRVAARPPRLRAVRVAQLAAPLLAAEVATGFTARRRSPALRHQRYCPLSLSAICRKTAALSASPSGAPYFAQPASVAAAFFTAWATINSVGTTRTRAWTRCAHLAHPCPETPTRRRPERPGWMGRHAGRAPGQHDPRPGSHPPCWRSAAAARPGLPARLCPAGDHHLGRADREPATASPCNSSAITGDGSWPACSSTDRSVLCRKP